MPKQSCLNCSHWTPTDEIPNYGHCQTQGSSSVPYHKDAGTRCRKWAIRAQENPEKKDQKRA